MAELIRTEIDVPFPEVAEPHLQLELNSCRLTLRPGGEAARVRGTYDDVEGSMPLIVQQAGATVHIKQRPSLTEMLRLVDRMVPLDLVIGTGRPFALHLDVGASEGRLELGGLPLTRLEIQNGSAEQEIAFSAPNQERLRCMHVTAPRGRLTMRGLANANFDTLTVDAAEASCVVDLSGVLSRPGQAKITCVQGSLDIFASAATAVRIKLDAGLGTVDVAPGFTRKAGAYWNKAALAGYGPALDVRAAVLVGEVRLRAAE